MPWKGDEPLLFLAGLILRIFAFQFLLSGNAPLSSVWFFIGASDGAVLYTPLGILLGYLTVYVPLCLMILYAARRAVPQDHILAAKDLGASWRRIQYFFIFRSASQMHRISQYIDFAFTTHESCLAGLRRSFARPS